MSVDGDSHKHTPTETQDIHDRSRAARRRKYRETHTRDVCGCIWLYVMHIETHRRASMRNGMYVNRDTQTRDACGCIWLHVMHIETHRRASMRNGMYVNV